jgi:hypothetical protein
MSSQLPASRRFLANKVRTLVARARRLRDLTPERIGLRAQDIPFSPSPAHFRAANARLQKIDKRIAGRVAFLTRNWRQADSHRALVYMAMLEREVDRARRSFGMFFEIFSQRGSQFGRALAAYDMIAADCYRAIRQNDALVLDQPILKPLCYMEHGYSPSTNRRGVALVRLLGDTLPFPVIRIPWDRDNPWQSVFLHEVSHNLHADLGIWNENQEAVARRLLRMNQHPRVVTAYRRWHKEIFADLSAILLGGTSCAWGMMEFLAHPDARALTYVPGSAHPTGYIRGLILAEMVRRLGFDEEAQRIDAVWRDFYDPKKGHRIPPELLASKHAVIPAIVDEIAFQVRRNLGQRALADILPFRREDEAAIRRGAMLLTRGRVPDLPPRFLVSASRFAVEMGAQPEALSKLVIDHLAKSAASQRSSPLIRPRQAAA